MSSQAGANSYLSDISNAVDNDLDTYAQVSFTSAPQTRILTFDRPNLPILGEFENASVIWYGKGYNGLDAETEVHTYYNGNVGGNTAFHFSDFADGLSDGLSITTEITNAGDETNWEFEEMGLEFEVLGTGTGSEYVRLGAFILGVEFWPNQIKRAPVTTARSRNRQIEGQIPAADRRRKAHKARRKDDGDGISIENVDYTWLSGKGRIDDASGTVTGTANVLIVYAADIIEHLLRTEGGVSASNIDTSAFDTARSQNLMNTGFSLYEVTDLLDLIYDIAKNTRLFIWKNWTGTWTARAWEETWVSGDVDETIDFQFVDDYTYEYTPIKDIRNDVVVNYNKNYPLDKYEGQATDSDTTSQGTTASGYNITATLEVNNDYLKSDTAGSDYASWLIFKFANPRLIVRVTTMFMVYYAIELLDIVQLTDFPDAQGAAVNTKYFMVVGMRKQENHMTYTLLEVS
jgi:hypothetical protein